MLQGGRVGEGAGQEIERQVEAAAGREQILDIGIGLCLGQDRIESHEDDLGHRQAQQTADLSRDQFGDQGLDALPGPAELDHIRAKIVRLHEARQRPALPQRRHIPRSRDSPNVSHAQSIGDRA